mgnify:CR=1 FL=1
MPNTDTNTMQAWITRLNSTSDELYETLNSFFQSEDIFSNYWANVDKSTANQVDYYITDSIYLRLKIESGNNSTRVFSITARCTTSSTTSTAFSNTYNGCVSIYKVGYCMVLCVAGSTSSSALSDYSKTAKIIIDSTNSGEGKSLFYSFAASSSSLFDSSSSIPINLYTPYAASYSLKTATDIAQIAPLKNNISGKEYDNLYGVLLTPTMNNFVSFNGKKWFFTSGMALPAGEEEPTPVYIDTVTPSSS